MNSPLKIGDIAKTIRLRNGRWVHSETYKITKLRGFETGSPIVVQKITGICIYSNDHVYKQGIERDMRYWEKDNYSKTAKWEKVNNKSSLLMSL